MNIECGDCNDFVELTERNFGEILERYGFRPVKCWADRGGRECMLMVESDANRLLFVRSDGADTCELGSMEATFPEAGLYGEGEYGWYHIVTMLEFKTGKKLLTRRRLKRILDGKENHFAWQAELLSENAEMLFELFRGGNERTWQDEFAKYYQALIKG